MEQDKTPSSWTEDDLLELIKNQVEEGPALEYKECRSLQKTDTEKKEISKDVSAFANSAGGTLVYGVVENGHVPVGLDVGFDPNDISKEWLEQVIQGKIQPRISGIDIIPVSLKKTNPGRVVYVVSIPQGITAHQASDKRYYKRFNFEAVPMEDYELRDIMNRLKHPLLLPEFSFERFPPSTAEQHTYKLKLTLKNSGSRRAVDIKIVFHFPRKLVREIGPGYEQRLVTLVGDDYCEYIVKRNAHVIFQDDEWRVTDDSKFRFVYQINNDTYYYLHERNPFLFWKTFADDMPPQSGKIPFSELSNF